MSVVLAWLSRQAVIVYGLCVLGAVGYMISAGTFKRRRDIAQFSLEREVHQQRMVRAWTMAVIFLLLGGVVFVVKTFVLPAPPAPVRLTPTLQVGLRTPTPSPFPTLAATGSVTQVVVSGPTPVATESSVPLPTTAPVEATLPDCPSPGAQVTSPVANTNLLGVVEIFGTAKVNSFSFYKFEVRFPGADTPNFIAQYNAGKENDLLGVWDISDPTLYPPGGPYQFQLVVVDIYGNTTTCTIPLNIVATQP